MRAAEETKRSVSDDVRWVRRLGGPHHHQRGRLDRTTLTSVSLWKPTTETVVVLFLDRGDASDWHNDVLFVNEVSKILLMVFSFWKQRHSFWKQISMLSLWKWPFENILKLFKSPKAVKKYWKDLGNRFQRQVDVFLFRNHLKYFQILN